MFADRGQGIGLDRAKAAIGAPEIAPAFSAYRPSMAIAENCSCIFGIPTVRGHKKSRAA
jgi:hypothetical protein